MSADEAPLETSEGRRARQHKMRLSSILDEMVEAMESARMDGFIVEFGGGLQPAPDERYVVTNLNIVKRW